jgi:diacylglycerol kinase family enzyme
VAGLLLVNPHSGSSRPDPEAIAEAARAAGIEPHLVDDWDDAIERARTAAVDAIGVAGGDGSLARVAEVALERGLPFVCVPAGTRNHFAGDLGLRRNDPLAALAAFSGSERLIDVGRVNDRLFLNNVSLGAYAKLVEQRERHRRRGDALARARALWRMTKEPHRLRLTLDGRPLKARIVLVANNAYELDVFTLRGRPRLDTGELVLYSAAGWLPGDWTRLTGERFELGAQGPIAAAADGEPLVLEPPLRFEILPRALRVLVPAESS